MLPAVFTAFVEKVVVSGTKKDVRLRFVLRDGSEYKVDGVSFISCPVVEESFFV